MENIELPEDVWALLRHKSLIPTCCVEHKVACSQSKNIDVSRWKFPSLKARESIGFKKHDVMSRLTPLRRKRQEEMKEFNEILEQLKVKAFLQQFRTSLDPAMIIKISNLLDIKIPKSTDEESDDEVVTPEISDISIGYEEESLMSSDVRSSSNAEIQKHTYSNPYINLLRRLRREELEQKFPDPELIAVKTAEEELQHATVEFCQWAATLGQKPEKEESFEDYSSEEEAEPEESLFDVKTLRRMFYIAYGKPIHCPHIPTVVREPLGKVPPMTPVQEKKIKKMHVAWYLSPKIWFKSWDDLIVVEQPDYSMSTEEIMLASSYTVKKYLEYMETKNILPPKALLELMQKQKMRLSREHEHLKETEHSGITAV